jgi:hypothetical protein
MISAQTLRVCREGKPVPTFPDHALRRESLRQQHDGLRAEIETMAEINQAPRAYSAKLDTGFANRIRATYKSRAFSCGKPDATLPENALWGA